MSQSFFLCSQSSWRLSRQSKLLEIFWPGVFGFVLFSADHSPLVSCFFHRRHVVCESCTFSDKRAVAVAPLQRLWVMLCAGRRLSHSDPQWLWTFLKTIFPPLVHTCAYAAITLCHPVAVSAAVVWLFSIYLLSKRYSLPHKKCSATQGSSSVKLCSKRAKVKFK